MRVPTISNLKATVGVCTYNADKYIVRAIKSALTQTHENIEVIVYDDGSTDTTQALLSRLRDSRLRVLGDRSNRGLAYGRNVILGEAQGQYITWLDADDIFVPTRLSVLLQASVESGTDIMTDAYRVVNAGGRGVGILQAQDRSRERAALPDNFASLLARNYMLPHPLMRTEAVRALKFDESLRVSEDYDFWLQALDSGLTFQRLPSVGLVYQVTPGSLSSDVSGALSATQRILRKRSAAHVEATLRNYGTEAQEVNRILAINRILAGDVATSLKYLRREWHEALDDERQHYLGNVLLVLGRHMEALEALVPLEAHHPTWVSAQNNVLVAKRCLGEDVREKFGDLSSRYPNYSDARINAESHAEHRVTLSILDASHELSRID